MKKALDLSLPMSTQLMLGVVHDWLKLGIEDSDQSSYQLSLIRDFT